MKADKSEQTAKSFFSFLVGSEWQTYFGVNL